ncbi:phosphoribosyltransferase [Haloarchaeobius iranensis]|uniref:Hypoxanthine phosphoribosyltransferase n=1 Tax=Haloarchaeobius iranensis TaxID=996166 RepID=A0A1H0A4K5_9EURY|nr:phosphoribosyltransferase family protein [Haloarchaeobius iranensis]SDN28762.1 hypoxanthine phosphoribosyltransferase [Haloarchaeobius iranensis]
MLAPIDVRDRDLYEPEQFDIGEAHQSALEGVLIPRAELEERVAALGSALADEHRSNPDFYPVCVLKGAMRFFVDLLCEVDLAVPYSEGIVHTSRYDSGPTTETPAVEFFDEDRLAGKDVVLVEDILHEGHTLATLRDRVAAHDPNSVTIVTLFEVDVDRDVDVDPAYSGFLLPDSFFVGYGLDYEERHRDLRHLGVLDRAIWDD